MKNNRLFFLFIPLTCITFLNCERDDICIEGVIESPDLILLFLDTKDVSARKSPLDFSIRAIGNDVPVPRRGSSDSLLLPLKIQENNVQFEFIINKGSEEGNIDTLQINYQRFDTFINSACGFRSNFILENEPAIILNPGDNWINGFKILKDTISNEETAHLGILH